MAIEKRTEFKNIQSLMDLFDQQGYVVDESLATVVFLLLQLQKPILVEGNPGVGKTDLAIMLAKILDTNLIRLQCYEGLDVHSAVYEWNYQKQLLSIKIQEQGALTEKEKEALIFGEDYLMERPLLKAIRATEKAPVLLIDEIDRADEEFEAFLLELLSAYQISIPEMGTVKATHIPYVVLTSNRTRELSDALKRRCLYHWVPYPAREKEQRIVEKKIPDIDQRLAHQIVHFVQKLRAEKLEKVPGIAETLDWAAGLLALGCQELNEDFVRKSLGCLLKSTDDFKKLEKDDWKEWLKMEI